LALSVTTTGGSSVRVVEASPSSGSSRADIAKEIAMVAVAATWRRAIGLLGYGAT